MKTILISIRLPNNKERKRGAEIVFERRDNARKRDYTILACRCYESWEQWGAAPEVLGDNVSTVEKWRRGMFEEEYDGN